MDIGNETFGEILKLARVSKQKDLENPKSLADMGKDLDIGSTVTNWYQWEQEKLFPKLEVVIRIADYFDISSGELTLKWVEAKTNNTRLKLVKKREEALKEL